MATRYGERCRRRAAIVPELRATAAPNRPTTRTAWLRAPSSVPRLSRAATRPRCAAGGSPTGRARRGHRASRYPAPRRRGEVVAQHPGQRLVVDHPLPQDHLGGAVRAVDGLEGCLELDDARALPLLGTQRAVGIQSARLVQVGLQTAGKRPRGVLHEEAVLVRGRVGGDTGQVDVLQRRPRHRGDDLGLVGVSHRVHFRRPRGQVADAHPLGQLPPGGGVAAAGDGDDGVGGPAPVRHTEEPEQSAAVALRQGGDQPVAVRLVEGVLARTGDPVHFMEQQHGVPPCGPLSGGGDAPVDRNDGTGQVGPGS